MDEQTMLSAKEADGLIDALIKASREYGYLKVEGFGAQIGISSSDEAKARADLEMFLAHHIRKFEQIRDIVN